jgi:choline monooxygenase
MNSADIAMDPRIEQAATLPKRFYNDPELYQASLEKLFVPSWQFIGDTSVAKVPGAVYPFTLLEGSLNEPLLITRDLEDKLHLVSNVCTHRGNLVCEGAGNERFLRCRYHGRRFGLDGRFQSMPEFEGVTGFPSEADHLAPVSLANWGPLLFGSIAPEVPFSETFFHAQERLQWLPLQEFRHDAARSKDYLIKAHWALYVDNYLEGFHIPFIHAALNQALDYENYTYELFEHGNLQLGQGKPGEDCFDLPPNSPDFGKHIAAYYYWIFPNLMLNFYPWGLSINIVRPLGPELTRVSFISYVWQEERLGQGAGAALDRVEREDEAVIETVQKGIKSRFYNRGRYSPKREIGTHHFHQMVARALAR